MGVRPNWVQQTCSHARVRFSASPLILGSGNPHTGQAGLGGVHIGNNQGETQWE